MDLSQLLPDEEAELEGVEHPFDLDDGTLWVRLRYAGGENVAFENGLKALTRELRDTYRDITKVPNKVFREKAAPLYAKHIVTGWRDDAGNVPQMNGKDFPCDDRNAITMLTKVRGFFEFVQERAQNPRKYRRTERDAGNSESASAGS